MPVHISELRILLWDSLKAGCLFLKTLVAVVAIGVVLYLISVYLILYISAIRYIMALAVLSIIVILSLLT